jgi:hypothetical protein
VQYSIGWSITEAERTAITTLPASAWTPALAADGGVREGAEIAELTGLLTLTGWPQGARAIVRRERPHPGAQLSLFEERDGWRYTAFITNTQVGALSSQDSLRAGSSAARAFCHPPHGHGSRRPVRTRHLGELTQLVPFEMVDDVLADTVATPTSSALAQARHRIGVKPLAALFTLLAGPAPASPRWRGLLLCAIDGTTMYGHQTAPKAPSTAPTTKPSSPSEPA